MIVSLYLIIILLVLILLYSQLNSYILFNDKFLLLASLLSVGCSISFYWIYDVFYEHSGDVFNYLKQYESLMLTNALTELTSQPRAKYFVLFSFPLYLFSAKTIWGLSIAFVLFSVFSKWIFYNAFKRQTVENPDWPLFLSLFVLPSFVFWTSGITKEAFVVSLVLLIFSLFKTKTFLSYLLLVFLTVIILLIKPYIVILLSLFFTGYFIHNLKGEIRLVTIFTALFIGIITVYLYPQFSLLNLSETINQNAQATLDLNGTSDFSLSVLGSGILLKSIYAYFVVLLKPLFYETENFLFFLQGCEKLVFVILTILSFFYIKRRQINALILEMVLWVLVLSLLLTLSSPNYGSLSRYSVYYTPVWLYLVLDVLFKKADQSIKSNKANDQGDIHQPTSSTM